MRRLFIGPFSSGEFILSADQAHYLRDVLRMKVGDELEVFDGQGAAATATIQSADESGVKLQVGPAMPSAVTSRRVIVASATPKGNRADWMVEKLAELGVAMFIPLKTERTIVLPEGQGKSSRWQRISQEASRQSGRSDVMEIGSLMTLAACLEQIKSSAAIGWILSTQSDAAPVLGNANAWISRRAAEPQRTAVDNALIIRTDGSRQVMNNGPAPMDQSVIEDGVPTPLRGSAALRETSSIELGTGPIVHDLVLLIGPEGGWTDRELALATAAGVLPVRLTRTVLRIETAAIAAATVACAGEKSGAVPGF